MDDDATTGRRAAIDRSPRFPFIPLSKALDRVAQFYEHEKRGVAPYSAVAQHWGYSPSSSGALQTLAALKNYGLLEGGRNSLRLTDLAIRILLDKRPDPAERIKLMRQAALNPIIAAEVNKNWPDDLPSDATLNHFLVLEREFNEATARKAIEILKQNELLTKSARTHDISHALLTNEESDAEQEVKENTSARHVISTERTPQTMTPRPDRVQQLTAPSGESVELRFAEVPTKRVYEFLKAYANFMAIQCAADPMEGGPGGETSSGPN